MASSTRRSWSINAMALSMRQILTLAPVVATLLGTLISALRNAVNFSHLDRLCIGSEDDVHVVQTDPGGKEVARLARKCATKLTE